MRRTRKSLSGSTLQFGLEKAFNLFNRKNFTFNGQDGGLSDGARYYLPDNASDRHNNFFSTFGKFTNVIGYPLNGSARQLQFGLKLLSEVEFQA